MIYAKHENTVHNQSHFWALRNPAKLLAAFAKRFIHFPNTQDSPNKKKSYLSYRYRNRETFRTYAKSGQASHVCFLCTAFFFVALQSLSNRKRPTRVFPYANQFTLASLFLFVFNFRSYFMRPRIDSTAFSMKVLDARNTLLFLLGFRLIYLRWIRNGFMRFLVLVYVREIFFCLFLICKKR